jgi:thioredoxin-dependent peroxiredoxin
MRIGRIRFSFIPYNSIEKKPFSQKGEESMTTINIGDQAPDFSLPSQNGKAISLADFRGKCSVVLFFYPKDESPICTKEACSFRDAYEDFVKAGATVIGISSDSAESHQAFAEHHRLPFLLLVDTNGNLRKTLGVPKTMGILPGRVTYVIDKEGTVRLIFNSQLSAADHVAEALKMVEQLA